MKVKTLSKRWSVKRSNVRSIKIVFHQILRESNQFCIFLCLAFSIWFNHIHFFISYLKKISIKFDTLFPFHPNPQPYRLGRNFAWRGRQTLCQPTTQSIIENDRLIRIRTATSVADFRHLLASSNLSTLPPPHPSQGYNNQNEFANLRCSSATNNWIKFYRNNDDDDEGEEKRFPRAPVSSPVELAANIILPQQSVQGHRQHQRRRRQQQQQYEHSNSDDESVEWYIRLASRCYREGIQWHMNYLSGESTRRHSELLRQRTLRNFPHQSTATNDNVAVPPLNSLSAFENISSKNYDSDATDDNNDNCKISINIVRGGGAGNGKKSNHFQREQFSDASAIGGDTMNGGGFTVETNQSGCCIDSINNNNNNINNEINKIVENFSVLSCAADNRNLTTNLPNIVLTDCSAAVATAVAASSSTILLSSSSPQSHHSSEQSVETASCHINQLSQDIDVDDINDCSRRHLLLLSIPVVATTTTDVVVPTNQYYQCESRPP